MDYYSNEIEDNLLERLDGSEDDVGQVELTVRVAARVRAMQSGAHERVPESVCCRGEFVRE